MHKVDLPADVREDAVLERRRNKELQRRSRIFNTHVRTIGIDKKALDAQIREKKIKDEIDKKIHAAYATDMTQNEKISTLLEERQEQDTRNLKKAIEEFRQSFQKPGTCPEFDLNDPQAQKKDIPARISDNDPRCTIAGLQKFLGEDLNSKHRLKFQQEQLREWSMQQQQELEKARADKIIKEILYDQKRKALDQITAELQQSEEHSRQAVCTATQNFNMALIISFYKEASKILDEHCN
ncbi:RIB43A-like with coiled-coils protein 2 [Protopterus annectens]|uniref:RIB43A-like with coiled-coils protein 2 n=1 Tax=Protopterus annectens TaxID=7888 RepID=UPI001CFBD287|nr:RIB43A-like with coiled-coils protein 2 [Protopterus annectens]